MRRFFFVAPRGGRISALFRLPPFLLFPFRPLSCTTNKAGKKEENAQQPAVEEEGKSALSLSLSPSKTGGGKGRKEGRKEGKKERKSVLLCLTVVLHSTIM